MATKKQKQKRKRATTWATVVILVLTLGVFHVTIFQNDDTQSNEDTRINQIAEYICQNANQDQYANAQEAEMVEVKDSNGDFNYWKISCSEENNEDAVQSNLDNFIN